GALYNWYNYKWAGVDPTNGDPLYYTDVTDADGNVTLEKVNSTSAAKRYDLDKSPIPDLYGGFSTTLELYGFDFNASFAYQIGGWAYDTQYASLMSGGSAGRNWHKDIYKRWTPDRVNTSVPRLHADLQDINNSSDRFLTKASYLSLRNVTLGYTFPKSWMNRVGVENLRLFVTGDNLFLLSKRKGFDPRQSFSGDTGYAYSAMSTVSFGLNINF
ncbi:MAG: SusC/RagA family TonB-linked outer membrane protein, partial [Odoribacter sp.]|nr:SusC/RagA family TonB-linked outer membrane protein [Odoribacter sp.]